MDRTGEVAYVVFPYLCLTVFVFGHAYRYLTDRYRWNARSSEFLEKSSLVYGSLLFHFGILMTLLGHVGGLLIPQSVFDFAGIGSELHLSIAYWVGLPVGTVVFAGAVLLFRRRITNSRVRAAGTVNDTFTIGLLVVVIGTGLYNVFFEHYSPLYYTLAPWIRGVITFMPEPGLMRDVPMGFKVHVVSALALLGFSPFSRLVHVWSIPLGYVFRRFLIYRRYRTNQVPFHAGR